MGWEVSCLSSRCTLLSAHPVRRTPVTILDDDGRVVAVLVGRPLKKSGEYDDWPQVVAGLEAAINRLERDSTFSDKQSDHRRGPHRAKAFGVSHGGGQKVCRFSLHSVRRGY